MHVLKYGYEYETNATYPKITKEKIIDTGDLMVKTAVISFWIANNHKILFSKKDEKSERMFAENILGNASYIQNISVDIKKIQEASKKGRLSGQLLLKIGQIISTRDNYMVQMLCLIQCSLKLLMQLKNLLELL